MDDQIGDGLYNILHKLWALNSGDDCYVEDAEDIKPYTADGVPIRKLFIGNLAQRTTHKDLEKLFSTYGKLDSCYLKRNRGKSNYAFVTFNIIEGALEATKDGYKKKINLHNRDLRVFPADSWHQPDSPENLKKRIKEEKQEISLDYDLDGAEIHKLNNDCLMHIFTFLPIVDRVRAERVCKRWRNVSLESWRTFKKLDLTQSTWGFKVSTVRFRKIDTPTLRKILVRCGEFITHIDFSEFAESMSTSTLSVVGKICPNLQYVNVTGLKVSPAGINALTANCSNIIEFSLGNSSATCDNDLAHLFSKNKKLKYLRIEHNYINGKCFLSLPVDSIERIILFNCSNISPVHFYSALQTFKNLQTLSLEKCVTFNDQAVKAISLCSKSLKELYLCGYFPMINHSTMPVLAELINLEVLDVSQNVLVRDEFLKAVGAQCKKLNRVDISSCHNVTNQGLASITALPELEHLRISYLGKISDEVLGHMPKLRTLQCRGCPTLKNEGLIILIEEAPFIELLDLSGCNHVSNELVKVAIKATASRKNNVILKIFVGKTKVKVDEITEVSPLLQVLNVDLSESHLRPDFNHDEDDFFPDESIEMDELDEIDDCESFPGTDDGDDLCDYYDYVGAKVDSDEDIYII